MYTIVVRKADGSLVEVSHEDKLSFSVNRQTGLVDVWVYKQFDHIANIEGVEAWVKGTVKAINDDYTGYYMQTARNEVYVAHNNFVCPDGETRFALFRYGCADNQCSSYRSHAEWMARGFAPIKKVD